ncbi:hypothetical protein [Citreimonas sp.]|uniref:hypothetical protein n=1 Tax=Citreimonas sp. TaxID=3036715 RepID=UPI004058F8CA
MPDWPSTVPWINLGFTIQPQDGTIRTPMSAGPAKQRPRFSAFARAISAEAVMSDTEFAALETFYYDTLAQGSLTFTQKDPRTGNDATWRFTGPIEAAALRSEGGTLKADVWRVSLPLEILP